MLKSIIIAFKVVLGVGIVFAIYTVLSMSYARYLLFKVKDNSKVYVYDDFSGKGLNGILYAANVNDCEKLIDYYSSERKGEQAFNPVPTRYLRVDRPVYVINYIGKDSSIIEFIDIATCCWGHAHGFVDKSTTHVSPPSEERLRLYHEFLEQLPPSPKYVRKISEYGLYCGCE